MIALDDCFAFTGRRLLHAEAIDLLSRLDVPPLETEMVDLFQAAGRVCAETISAPRHSPAHDNSAVDGYAFEWRCYDAVSGSTFEIGGRVAAGDAALSLPAVGRAIRILTGAMMPEGFDTVAMQEDCRVADHAFPTSVYIPGGLKQGANRRLAGEDTASGDVLVRRGDRLRPQDIAAIAAAGIARISCFRRLRVCVFSTGNEVLNPGDPFTAGRVYDANAPLLHGLFAPLEVTFTHGGILPDNRERVTEALREAALNNDMIVTSGGASLGDEDHVVAALRAMGSLSLWQLAIKPGRPMGVGKIRSCLCLALPGNPVAVFVCALLYAWPAACHIGGQSWPEPLRLDLQAGFDFPAKKRGRREFFRGWLEREDGRLLVKKYERDGSGLVSSLRASTGLIEIPEDTASIAHGDPVRFIPLSQYGIL